MAWHKQIYLPLIWRNFTGINRWPPLLRIIRLGPAQTVSFSLWKLFIPNIFPCFRFARAHQGSVSACVQRHPKSGIGTGICRPNVHHQRSKGRIVHQVEADRKVGGCCLAEKANSLKMRILIFLCVSGKSRFGFRTGQLLPSSSNDKNFDEFVCFHHFFFW